MKKKNYNSKYVGLDIGSGLIKLANLGKVYEIDTNKKAVQNGVITNIPKVSAAIKTLVYQHKLNDKRTVISYNGPGVFTKELNIPLMNEQEISKYLSLEGDSIVPFPIKEGMMDYIVLGKQEKSMEILALALKNDLMTSYIQTVKLAELQPMAMDIPALAIYRELDISSDGLCLVLDIGKTTTDIHIYQNGVFRFSRIINIGGDDFDKTLAASLNLDLKEAYKKRLSNNFDSMLIRGIISDLKRELTRSIEYFRYRHGGQDINEFTQVHIIGGNAGINPLKDLLREITGTDSITIDSSKGLIAQGLAKWEER